MKTTDYDNMLLERWQTDNWENIPKQDILLFSLFGSVAPKVALQSHRLVPSCTVGFRECMTVLESRAGLLRVVPPSLADKDYEAALSMPPEDMLRMWSEAGNQEHLIEGIEDLKHGSSWHLICDADLSREKVKRLVDSVIFKGLRAEWGPQEWSEFYRDWYATLASFVGEYSWFYVPLSEITKYDLLVTSGELAKRVFPLLDSRVKTAQISWHEGRAHWPIGQDVLA